MARAMGAGTRPAARPVRLSYDAGRAGVEDALARAAPRQSDSRPP